MYVLAAAALFPFVRNDLALSPKSAAVLAFLGVVQIAGAYALFVEGLKHVTATQASLAGMLEPIANPISLLNAALATSSPCFTRRQWHGRTVSHLVNPANRRAITSRLSVSVRAGECWLADALTKVVLNADSITATRLLEAHHAEALILTA